MKYLESEFQSIKTRLLYNKGTIRKSLFLLLVAFLLTSPVWGYVFYVLIFYPSPQTIDNIILIMIFIPFPIFLYNELRKDFFIRRILEGIIAINSTLKQDQDKPRDIPTILNSIQQTYKATNGILHFQKFSKGSSLYGLYISECEYILNILSVLRSDLATRLTEQQQILKSAKTEVEENITGTPELIAVSEAQQVRLDRQIEQFEELQQVLVRV